MDETHPDFKELARLMELYSVGEHRLSVNFMKRLPENLEERPLDLDHVKKLEQSIRTKGTLDMQRVRVCFFYNPNKVTVPHSKSDFLADMDRWMEVFEKQRVFIVIGNHTVAALKNCSVLYPNNRKFSHPACKIDFVPDNQAGMWYIGMLGATDNTITSLSKKTEFRTMLRNLHRSLERITIEANAMRIGAKERKKWIRAEQTELKGSFRNKYGCGEGQYSLMKQTASFTGDIWNCISAILNCDIRTKGTPRSRSKGKIKAPKSVAPFTKLGGLDDASVLDLVSRVRDGRLALKDLPNVCTIVKAKARLQEAVKSAARWTRPFDELIASPGAAQAGLTDEWLESWAQNINLLKQSDKLPVEIVRQISTRVEQWRQWRRRSEADRQRRVTVLDCDSPLTRHCCGQERAMQSSSVRVMSVCDNLNLTIAHCDCTTMATEQALLKKHYGQF